MIVYLDFDYCCHLTNDGTMTAVETDFFDGKEKAYIEGYRYVPEGQMWTRSDGVKFKGIMVAPAKKYDRIMVDVALEYLDDQEAESVTTLFEDWKSGVSYHIGDRRKYQDFLYRCIQSHNSIQGWEPPNVPALWTRTSVEEWPEWIQPTGAQDAYRIDDKVSHNGQHWINTIDYNTYEPGVYGWNLVEE